MKEELLKKMEYRKNELIIETQKFTHFDDDLQKKCLCWLDVLTETIKKEPLSVHDIDTINFQFDEIVFCLQSSIDAMSYSISLEENVESKIFKEWLNILNSQNSLGAKYLVSLTIDHFLLSRHSNEVDLGRFSKIANDILNFTPVDNNFDHSSSNLYLIKEILTFDDYLEIKSLRSTLEILLNKQLTETEFRHMIDALSVLKQIYSHDTSSSLEEIREFAEYTAYHCLLLPLKDGNNCRKVFCSNKLSVKELILINDKLQLLGPNENIKERIFAMLESIAIHKDQSHIVNFFDCFPQNVRALKKMLGENDSFNYFLDAVFDSDTLMEVEKKIRLMDDVLQMYSPYDYPSVDGQKLLTGVVINVMNSLKSEAFKEEFNGVKVVYPSNSEVQNLVEKTPSVLECMNDLYQRYGICDNVHVIYQKTKSIDDMYRKLLDLLPLDSMLDFQTVPPRRIILSVQEESPKEKSFWKHLKKR